MALNEAFSGSQGGLRGADFACFKESRRAGLRGTYRAMLTSLTQDLDMIVDARDRSTVPVVNLKDQLILPSFASIFAAVPYPYWQNQSVPALYSFDGRDVFKDKHWSVLNYSYAAAHSVNHLVADLSQGFSKFYSPFKKIKSQRCKPVSFLIMSGLVTCIT